MIFDAMRIDVAFLIFLVINGVTLRPQEDVANEDNNAVVGNIEIGADTIQGEVVIPESSLNMENNNIGSTITNGANGISGSIEIDDAVIKGNVNVHNDDNKQDSIEGQENLPTNYEQQLSTNNNNNQQPSAEFPEESDVITGSIQLNGKNVKGHVDFPDGAIIQDDNNEQESGDHIKETIDIPDDDNKNVGDAITGSVEINGGYVQGTIDIPDDANNKKDEGSNQNEAAITGNVEINENYLQGNIDIPSEIENEGVNQQQNLDFADSDGVVNTTNEIKGTIKIDDDNIQGHIEIPDSAGVDVSGVSDGNIEDVGGNKNVGDAITGTVEINGDYVQGTIDIPDDDNKNVGDAITGSVEINGDYVQGTIDIPDDANNIKDEGSNQNEAAITGNIEINENYLQGNIDIPSEIENQGVNQQQNLDFAVSTGVVDNTKEIKGTIEIDNDNIQGHIEIPDSAGADVSGGTEDGRYIKGTVEIDDDNIQGNIEIPDEENNQDDDAAIIGSINMDDDNIEGHIEIPHDSDDRTIKNEDSPNYTNYQNEKGKEVISDPKTDRQCWMDVKSKPYLDALDKLDATNRNARQQYEDHVGKDFDKKMLQVLLASQGAAPRAIHEAKGDPYQIPAGINLGGHCMMRMHDSLLFFYRMKLRNNTRFRVEDLVTSLMNMTLLTRLSMKELYLRGAYERSKTGNDPTVLYYVPTFGELDVVLENVKYKLEGRLRLLKGRLLIELVCSNLEMSNIVLKYDNQTYWTHLESKNVEDYLDRLKTDLDAWMKDYFNDYLMYFGIVGNDQDSKIQAYEKQKTVKANEYADAIIKQIKQRIKSLGASTVKLPIFKIQSMNNIKLRLKSGLLRGLDSIYRRSVAMTKTEKAVRHLDFIASFSKLKVEYQYEAMVYRHMPPLMGTLILSADELTAHAHVMEQDRTNSFAIDFQSITQIKPESLTIEGPANRVIADYKHILEHPLLAIIINILTYNIKMLTTLTHCEPLFKGLDVRREQSHAPLDPGHKADNKIDNEPDVNKYFNDKDKGEGDGNGEYEDRGLIQGAIPEDDEEDDKQWVDYTVQKNDSVEIEVPINGETQNFKLHRDEKLVLSKLP